MIRPFRDQGTEDLFLGRNSKPSRKVCLVDLWNVAQRKLDQLNQSEALVDLKAPPGNRLEKLKEDREEQHSIRINDQFRICFRWTGRGPEDVEVVDYH